MVFLIILSCTLGVLTVPSSCQGVSGRKNDLNGIIAFDCNGTHLDVMTYDLTHVAECQSPTNVTTNERMIKIQIVQRKDSDLLLVRRCHIVAHTLIWHCGMHSHSAIANYDIAPMPVDVSKNECHTLHVDGKFVTDTYTFRNIKPNTTSIVSHTAVGSVWGEGHCSGGTVTFGGYTYKNVVVKRSYTIQLQEKMQYYKVGSEEIMSYNGVTCSLSASTCYDYEVGRIYWDIPRRECHQDHYDSIYAGAATLITTSRLGPHDTYIRVHSSSRNKFQLFTPLVMKTSVCSLDGWSTPYTGLYVVEFKDRPPLPTTGPLPANVDIIRYIETKFMTFAHGVSLTTIDIIQQLAFSQCKALRETLLNRLHIIAANPSSANLLVNNKPGIFGRVAGEVIHILQCPPVEVHLRRSTVCTNEIPIVYRDQPLYMDSRTRIITDIPTHQDCSILTPTMFRHGQSWVKMAPAFSPAENPKVLMPHQDVDFQFHKLVSYAQGGIYDPSDLQQVRNFMMFSTRRDAMTSNILAGLEGRVSTRYDLTQVLHEDGWKALAKDRLRQMWGDMQVVGEWVSGFIGIYFCITLIKLVIGVLIRTFNIYKLTGLSWSLCAGIWSVFTQYVLSTLKPTSEDPPKNGAERDMQNQPKEEDVPLQVVETSTAPQVAPRATSLYPTDCF